MAALLAAVALAGCDSGDGLDEIREMQATGRVAESVEALQALIDAGDRRNEVLFRYGRALSATGEIGRAVFPLDAVIDDPEYTVPAAKNLAHNAVLGGNYELALDVLERLKKTRTDGEAETDVKALIIEARALLNARRFYDEALEVVEQILELEPDNDEALRYRVVALLGNGENEEAYQAIRQLGVEFGGEERDAESEDSRAFWCSVAASFSRESGDLDQAREVVDQCLAEYPGNHKIIEEAIQIRSLQGRRDEALAILVEANEADPDDRALRMPLVRYYRDMGRYDDAEALLREAIEREKAKEFPDPTTLANRWNDLGLLLVDRGDLDDGIAAYDEVLGLIGDNVTPEFWFARAEALMRVGRFDDALEIAERTPVEVHRPMIRGRVAFERGDFQRANEALREAARVWPDNAPIRYYLGRTAEMLGEFDRAVEEYRQAIRSDRSLAAPRVRLGRLHMAEGRVLQSRSIMMFASPVDNALESVDSKEVMVELSARTGAPIDLRNFPSDPELSDEAIYAVVFEALSRGLRGLLGATGTTERLAELHASAPPALTSYLLVERVDQLVDAGDAPAALELARSAAAKQPDDVRVQLALGRALAGEEGTRPEAQSVLEQVVAEAPDAWQAFVWLGELALGKGEPERALDRFDAALAVVPDHEDAVLGVARALEALGRRPEAIARLETFLTDQDPYAGEASLALARLIEAGKNSEPRRIELGLRALRFGAGRPAAEFLSSIDPLRFALEPEGASES